MSSLPREVLEAAAAAPFVIRRMVEADVPKVAESERLGYAFPWSEGIFRDCIRAGYHCRVMEVEEQFAGYAVLSTGAGEAHVLNVCIRPEYRFRGLGRRMMEHLFDVARACGTHDLFLEVRPSNVTAVRLYQSLGLQLGGLRRGYYQAEQGREDAIVMRLSLQPR
ncbi:MAG: ribosomal protein S18-alanine N-acetyltransferase [Steroidobacteraceae bacterium]